MRARKTGIWLSLLAVLAVAALIFFFSSQAAEHSARASGRVTEILLKVFVPDYARLPAGERAALLSKWEHAVRKLAHFTEYALLGLTLVIHLRLLARDKRLRIIALLACAIAAAYAASDEVHQLFVSERGPAVLDVFIDTAGALFGAAIGSVVFALRRRAARKGRSSQKDSSLRSE